ncbi:MAG: HepT-like ribonuclease domain-containing protein [Desulfomonile sp.]|jgi:uncharacterized protein with HEPN domain
MSSRRWRFFVDDILTAIGQIQSYVREISFEEFCQNDLLLSAVERKFIIIGEAARHIPILVLESYPSVPWRQMAHMRHIVAHLYWGVKSPNPMGHGPSGPSTANSLTE